MQGVLRPGGVVDLGNLIPGTSTLQYADGTRLHLPDDGGILAGDTPPEDNIGLQSGIATTQQNASDGPYRRVRSKSNCTGSYGLFYPGWRNQISMAKDSTHVPPIDDDYWTYLGSRTVIGIGKKEKNSRLMLVCNGVKYILDTILISL